MVRRRRKTLAGLRFGKLLVIRKCKRKGKRNSVLYECRCDCGTIKYLQSNALNINSGTKSCGCMRRTGKHARLRYRESSMRNLFSTYKNKADARSLCFELTIKQFKDLTSSNCFYCETHPQQINYASKRSYGGYVYNGIDRKDNNEGYKIENCVTCCGRCNRAKDTMTQQDFFDWIVRLYENHRLC